MKACWKSWLSLLVPLLLGWVASTPAHAEMVNHVRIVLDTSGSMKGFGSPSNYTPGNDPGRLAVLSTMLLHDLLRPQGQMADTFGVIPFDRNLKWNGSTPPQVSGGFIYSQGTEAVNRNALLQRLSDAQMPRTAIKTSFAPYIRKALGDLQGAGGGATATRTIIIISDGVAEPPDDVPDQQAIIAMLPELAAKGVRLLVIYFCSNPKKFTVASDFWSAIKAADDADVMQSPMPRPAVMPFAAFGMHDGAELPKTTIRLFADAFGYAYETGDHAQNVGGAPVPLDIARTYDPLKAVVVAFRNGPGGAGSTGPNAPVVAIPPQLYVDDTLRYSESGQDYSASGGAYSATWLDHPADGLHNVAITDGTADSVFVLRPTRLTIALRESPGNEPSCLASYNSNTTPTVVLETMADQRCWLDFLVQSSGTASLIQPNLNLKFWLSEPRGGKATRLIENQFGMGTTKRPSPIPNETGERFYYRTIFESDPAIQQPRTFDAHVKVLLNSGSQTIVSYDDDFDKNGNNNAPPDRQAFKVKVYPLIQVTPDPAPPNSVSLPDSTGSQGQTSIKPQQTATVRFNLKEDKDRMLDGLFYNEPNPADESLAFTVDAWLATLDANGVEQDVPPDEIKGSSFQLDGKSICFRSAPADADCQWNQGQALRRAEFVCRGDACQTRQHALEIKTGQFDSGDPENPPTILVKFRIRQSPYARFDVVKPLRVKVYIAPHPFSLLLLLPFLALLLALLAALLLLRPRFALPKDLGYSIDDGKERLAQRLPGPGPLALLFNARAPRLITDKAGVPVGWAQPMDVDLFSLRPATGVVPAAADGAELLRQEDGSYLLGIYQSYRLLRGRESLRFRFEYLPEAEQDAAAASGARA